MLTPNTMLQNRYLVLRPVGRGGMGTVYEATDTRLNARVALKETLLQDRAARRAFEREAQLLAQLRHPALPKVIDHFTEGAGQFLVMDFIAGDDLSTLMEKRGGCFPPAAVVPWVLRWAEQLLDALDHLHRLSPPVFHRDIKPQNLKLTTRGDIILLDFGLARGGLTEVSTLTARGDQMVGFTPNYAPLEQIRGSDTDARTDLYSLAATLYHMVTGIRPPDALTRVAALLNDQPDPLQMAHEQNTHIPLPISNLLHRTLATNIDERPASAAELRRLLHEARQQLERPAVARPEPAASQEMSAPALISSFSSPVGMHEPVTSKLDMATAPLADMPHTPADPNPAGTLLQTFQTGSPISCIDLSPNGMLLAIGGDENTIGLWDMHTSDLVQTLEGHEGGISTLVFSPDGSMLISGSEDKTVCLWRVSDGHLLYRSTPFSESIESIAWCPDGALVAVGGWGGSVSLCKIHQNSLEPVTEFFSSFVNSLTFSSDSSLLAAGCYDASIRFWNVQERRPLRELTGHKNFVITIAFAPNVRLLASAGGDTDIYVWRVSDGRLLDHLRGHTNFVRSLCFNPDGRLLASGSEDKTIRLWRTSDGEMLHQFEGHADGVTSVLFSPDGRTLISSSRDTKIRVWQV